MGMDNALEIHIALRYISGSRPLGLALHMGHCRPKYSTSIPKEVADQELSEGGDEHDITISHDVVLGAYPAAPPWPVPPIATVAPPIPPTGAPPISRCFCATDILPSEEAKCDRFRSGLHVGIRSSMTWFRRSNFRELVEVALNVEKVRQEEKEYEQKMSRKHGQSSSQGFRERPAKRRGSSSQSRTNYYGSGRGSYMSTG
ncbi:hypothetical protein GH714_006450 [Hevea brasiliensis]|uniref:Uncharacterized protein n=1 Tax=Hevea brasiliensis TaxID=3981 RepID=A0A6A6MCY4_HEVBR|nr:hypothetical protein GH714_006450 [Hevea brasiliensis]